MSGVLSLVGGELSASFLTACSAALGVLQPVAPGGEVQTSPMRLGRAMRWTFTSLAPVQNHHLWSFSFMAAAGRPANGQHTGSWAARWPHAGHW